ncbi:hypothetical protein NPIL_88181 [Nephila pilipes]|uniref:Uncharacterized protein n=1 Tax=Nephila pilipes TaxID=299642 RepID=A0A8X6IPR6_NEPPI|nr:hypothetical protein NPIL_88181 [Nephila pilipes]
MISVTYLCNIKHIFARWITKFLLNTVCLKLDEMALSTILSFCRSKLKLEGIFQEFPEVDIHLLCDSTSRCLTAYEMWANAMVISSFYRTVCPEQDIIFL